MWSLTRFCEKIYTMAEGGSDYCSKKSDDFCGNASASGEVKILYFMSKIQSLGDLCTYRSNCSGNLFISDNVWFCLYGFLLYYV